MNTFRLISICVPNILGRVLLYRSWDKVWFNFTAHMVKYMYLNLTCNSSRQLRILVWGSGTSFFSERKVLQLCGWSGMTLTGRSLRRHWHSGEWSLCWILCSCVPEISAWFWLGCLVDYYPQYRVSLPWLAKAIGSHLLIPDIAIPWLTELSAGAINSHFGGISVIDSWTPDARKLYKKTRQNRQKGKEFW